jgi:hypothetical protein
MEPGGDESRRQTHASADRSVLGPHELQIYPIRVRAAGDGPRGERGGANWKGYNLTLHAVRAVSPTSWIDETLVEAGTSGGATRKQASAARTAKIPRLGDRGPAKPDARLRPTLQHSARYTDVEADAPVLGGSGGRRSWGDWDAITAHPSAGGASTRTSPTSRRPGGSDRSGRTGLGSGAAPRQLGARRRARRTVAIRVRAAAWARCTAVVPSGVRRRVKELLSILRGRSVNVAKAGGVLTRAGKTGTRLHVTPQPRSTSEGACDGRDGSRDRSLRDVPGKELPRAREARRRPDQVERG